MTSFIVTYKFKGFGFHPVERIVRAKTKAEAKRIVLEEAASKTWGWPAIQKVEHLVKPVPPRRAR